MADPTATSILRALGNICGAHEALAPAHGALAAPLLGNILVAGAAGLVTVACFIVALRLLINPGERDPDHPKFRILDTDR